MKPTTNFVPTKSLLFAFFLCSLFLGNHLFSQATSVRNNVTFSWADTQTNLSDPATIQSITIDGSVYSTFVVPSNYELTRLGPGGHGGNHINQNGAQIAGSSNIPTWTTQALDAYQSINLNHYFESNSNGDSFCNDYGAVATTDTQIQTISYSPGIPSNPDGILAVTERGGNNCFYIEVWGTPVGGGAEQQLGQTFVRNETNLTGVLPPAPPTTNSDYWRSGRNNENGQVIGVALYKLSDLAPTGSTITSIRYYAATNDNGDGKFFLMQTYAQDDSFNPDFEDVFNGDVGANDNVPDGSSYSYFTNVDPLNGTVVVNTDGTFTYTPDPGFTGTDTFEVQVCLPAPNQSVCDTSTVTLNVKSGVSIDDASADEGDNLTFTITINDPISEDVEFDINYTDNSTTNADYTGPATVTLPANASSVRFNVAALNDNWLEGNQTFNAIISNPSNIVTITDDAGLGTIVDTDDATVTTGNYDVDEDAGIIQLRVWLHESGSGVEEAFTVDVAINSSAISFPATDGSDYNATTATLSFPANSIPGTEFFVPLTIIDDNIVEPSEQVIQRLSNVSFNTIGLAGPGGIVRIHDNDTATITLEDITVNEAIGTVDYGFTLSGTTQDAFTIDFATGDVSAVNPGDYVSSTGNVTFTGTNNERQVTTLTINDDVIVEPTEDFSVTGSYTTAAPGFTNAQAQDIILANNPGTVTITDNDGGPGIGLIVNDFTVDENDGTATFDVVLNRAVQGGFSVNYSITDGTAISPDDYTVTSGTGTLNFSGNNNETQSVTVNLVNDAIIEGTENLFIELSGLSTNLINIVDGNATGTINDDDIAGPTEGLYVVDNTVNEADGTVTVSVRLEGTFAPFSINYSTGDGTALDGQDYTATSGTLSFDGNDTEIETLTVAIANDNIIEAVERFFANISGAPVYVPIRDAQGSVEINDDDNNGTVGVAFDNTDITVTEGVGVQAVFPVSFNGNIAVGEQVTVDYTTVQGTALDGGDFTPTSGTLTFDSANNTFNINVPITNDNIIEPSEAFTVVLSNVQSNLGVGIVGPDTANGNINDDDLTGTDGISFVNTNVTVTEGVGVQAIFEVRLTGDFQNGFDVAFETAFGTATATDITAKANTISFVGNNNEVRTITVDILNDNILEPTEGYFVNLTGTTNPLVAINTAQATGTINDDDNNGTVGVAFDNTNITVTEGVGVQAVFPVSFNGNIAAGEQVTVDYTTVQGTALDGGDFTPTSGTLTFDSANTAFNINVPITNDNIIEPSEAFTVVLSNVQSNLGVGIVGPDTANGNINDDDLTGTDGISFVNTNVTVTEGVGVQAIFEVRLTGDFQNGFDVAFETAFGTATATDITAKANTISFVGNNNEVRTITVDILNDNILEPTEGYFVNLTGTTNTLVAINTAQATGTINDDDNNGTVGVAFDNTNITVTEGVGVQAVFPVSFNGNIAVGEQVTVDYTTVQGTALDGSDFSPTSGTLTFDSANTAFNINVPITNDNIIEPVEAFTVVLSNVQSNLGVGIVGPDTANGNINDDDNNGTVGVAFDNTNITVTEGVGVQAVFPVSFNGNIAAGEQVTVDYTTVQGTALDGGDFTPTSGTLTFDSANTAFNINVPITNDNIIEPSEAFTVVLSNVQSNLGVGIVGPDTANGTINDDDLTGTDGISFVNTNVTVTEGVGVQAIFEVRLTGDFQDSFDVAFETAFGTATATDITAQANTISFVGNNNEVQTITVDILNDNILEPTEGYFVNLTGTTNPLVAINTAQATGTINDDDNNGTVGVAFDNTNITVTEGVGVQAVFPVSFNGNIAAGEEVTVDYTTVQGTALDGSDFSPTSGTLTFDSANTAFNINVPITNDNIIEPVEAFTVVLSNVQSNLGVGIVGPDTANGTINDDDLTGTDGISFVNTNVIVTEGVGVQAIFEVRLTGDFQDGFDVAFETAFGTATATDITAKANTISFVGNNNEVQTITVDILNDNILEPTEGYFVNLTGTTNPLVAINTAQATGTINDDDLIAGIGIQFDDTDIVVTEGTDTFARFTVTLIGEISENVTVDFTTVDGTAVDGNDLSSNSGTITFTPTTSSFDIDVPILNDAIIEPTEDFTVVLSNIVSNLGIGFVDGNLTNTANGTILDDDSDPALGIQFDTESITVNEDDGTVSLNVVLNADVQNEFTITYHTLDGTATTTLDYSGVAPSSQTLTFGGTNDNIQVITLPIIDDVIIESTEDFQVLLSDISTTLVNILANDTATVNIQDNDGNEGWPEDITIEACDVIPVAETLTTDNACAITVDFVELLEGNNDSCPTEYTITRTWTITDCVGNVREHVQVITIEDTVAPEFVEALPSDMIVSCDSVPDADVLTAIDSCEPNMVVDFTETITGQDDSCPSEYTIVRTWSVADCAGNGISHTQTITVEDTEAPVFVEALPESMIVLCNEVPGVATLTAMDNCDPNIMVTFDEIVTNDANCSTGYTVTRTWATSDCAGNSVSHTQVITIEATGPITASDYEEELTILCGDVVPEVPELVFSGGCGDYEVVFNEETEFSDDTDDYMIIRTWDVTDSCGNMASFEQIIFVMQPQLEEVFLDICVEDEPIDLVNYLPEGFDTNGTFETELVGTHLNGSTFEPYGLEVGEYKVIYTSTAGTCKYFVDFYITVNKDCVPCNRDNIVVSQTVTVNGDNINDFFEVKGVEYCEFTFDVMIFNRWGDKVFEEKDYQNDWGGFAPNSAFGNSGLLPAGTYYYIININGADFKPLNGYIYLGTQ